MVKPNAISRDGSKGDRHTSELLVQPPTTRYTQCANELLEINRPILVFIKHVEYVVCELSGIAKRKELLVYATKLGLVELTRWTVF
jgi:hypothetical protein